MKDQSIFSTQKLQIGLLDPGHYVDRTALDACPNEYPSVEVLGETFVHRSLRDSGIPADRLYQWGDEFAPYENLKGFHLLLLPFRSQGQTYLRTVNYFGKYVTTVLLDVRTPTCGDILRAQRLFVAESIPPIADVLVDRRPVGEAPVWAWLRDGTYEITCQLPGQTFRPMQLTIPRETRIVCQRENVDSATSAGKDEKMTAEEGAGAVLIYIVGAAAAAAAIILPLLLFL